MKFRLFHTIFTRRRLQGHGLLRRPPELSSAVGNPGLYYFARYFRLKINTLHVCCGKYASSARWGGGSDGLRRVAVRPCAHLLISHELDGGLWNYLDDVDTVPSPERPEAALPDHGGEAPGDAHAVAFGGVHLAEGGESNLFFHRNFHCYYCVYRHIFCCTFS